MITKQAHERDRGLGALMARYVDGDERAFRELHRRLEPRVRQWVRRKIREPEAANDIVQAVFVKAHLARDRFVVGPDSDPDRAVSVWYGAIARNAAIDALRKIYRRKAHATQVGPEQTGEQFERLASAELDAEARLVAVEGREATRAIVRQAVADLPRLQREVLEMHKFEGLTMREISDRLEVREGTLRVRAHRAYKALAERLRPLFGGATPDPA